MPISEVVIKAFNVQNQAELQALCLRKKAEADAYYQDTSADFKMRRQSALDYSVLRIDGKSYLLAGKGNYLGEGSFGRVKLAIGIDDLDKLDELYAIKREISNTALQEEESHITKDVGIMVADKVSRPSNTPKQSKDKQPITKKYYSVLHYLGTDLFTLISNNSLKRSQKLDVAINTALALHDLHSRKPALVHRDLKPENVVIRLDSVPMKAHLIDFGFSQKNVAFSSAIIPRGTRSYVPALGGSLYRKRMEQLVDLKAADVFALKKTITGIVDELSLVHLNRLPKGQCFLLQLLQTKDEEKACVRKDSAVKIAAHIICYKLQIVPHLEFSEEQSQEIIALYQQNASTKAIKDKVQSFGDRRIREAFNICLNIQGVCLLNKKTVFTQELADQIIHLRDLFLKSGNPDLKDRIKLLLYFNALKLDISSFSQFTDEEIELLTEKQSNQMMDSLQYNRILIVHAANELELHFNLKKLDDITLTFKLFTIINSKEPCSLVQKKLSLIATYLDITPYPSFEDWASTEGSEAIQCFTACESPIDAKNTIEVQMLLHSLMDLNNVNELKTVRGKCTFKLNAFIFGHASPPDLSQEQAIKEDQSLATLCKQLLTTVRKERDPSNFQEQLLSFLDTASQHPINEHSIAMDILCSLFPDDVAGKLKPSHFSECLKSLHQIWKKPPTSSLGLII